MARPANKPHHPNRKPDWPPGKPPWVPGPPPWWEVHNPDKFLVIGYAHGWRDDNLDIKVITDTPCHLWMRLTEIEPVVHKEGMVFRGLGWMSEPRICFVEFTEIEERDPGDHYHHFWTLPSFGVGIKKWYYFRGEIEGDLCPSISCLFSVKYHEESQMITLGIFGEAQTLEGEVKLEEGDKVKLTRDDAHNSIIIESLVKELADLDDVSDAPADGQVLTWEAATSLWKPKPGAGAAGGKLWVPADYASDGVKTVLNWYKVVKLPNNAVTEIRLMFPIPVGFTSLTGLKMAWGSTALAGNMFWELTAMWASNNEQNNQHSQSPGIGVTATQGQWRINLQEPLNPLTLVCDGCAQPAGPDDVLVVKIKREANVGADTLDKDAYVWGLQLEFA